MPDLTRQMIEADDGTHIAVRTAGSGPPLLLLHGFPQNHRCWLKVLPRLAERFTCILPDLRGYGDSAAPADDATNSVYSKRRMAQDMVAVLDALGHDRAHVAGHDRGARVAYRFALDHPERVDRLAILEVIPTVEWWDRWNAETAYSAYHWTFLAQPAPLPERMIGADPAAWIDWTLSSWTKPKTLDPFEAGALASYRAQAASPDHLAAMCGDYRAGYFTDRRIDAADRAAGRRIAAPLHFIWGQHGFPAATGDPAAIWRDWAETVTDSSVDAGHFAMEEAPEEVAAALLAFFAG